MYAYDSFRDKQDVSLAVSTVGDCRTNVGWHLLEDWAVVGTTPNVLVGVAVMANILAIHEVSIWEALAAGITERSSVDIIGNRLQ